MKVIKIGQNDIGRRLDNFMLSYLADIPKSLICKLIRKKKIKVNNKKSSVDYRLVLGDIVEVFFNKIPEYHSASSNFFLKACSNLNIIYEDENILIINKPSGLICHPDKSGRIDCLINRIKKYLYNKNEFNLEKENIFSPALANRIDRNTEGIVLAAKNLKSLKELNEKIRNKEIKKYYKCLVYGRPRKDEEIITGFLTKDSDRNKVFISKKNDGNSRFIKTRYTLESFKNGISLLDVELLTGRPHQIRAHLASIGNPIVGDHKYGKLKKSGIKHQKLVSYKIKFEFKTSMGELGYLNNLEFKIPNSNLLKFFQII